MGTITERKGKKGISYRAQVRINLKDGTNFSESRTFSTRVLAKQWIKNLEGKIETDPDSVLNPKKTQNLSLSEALEKYLLEVESFGRSKRMGIRFLTQWPIGKIKLKDLKRQDFTDHTLLRRAGFPEIGAEPIEPSTALQDLQYLKVVLSHAELVWGEEVHRYELEQAMEGLRKARVITKSSKRNRVVSREELIQLTRYFYRRWNSQNVSMPLHLIMWLAIYTCRREDEITRLYLTDYDEIHSEWLLRDIKHPDGSKGNDKYFHISELTKTVLKELGSKDVRKRMLRLKGDPNLLVPLNSKSYAKEWREGVKMCGLEDLRFHDLRHEALTRLAEDGKTIPELQSFSLHDSWSSLERYVNIKRRRKDRLEFTEVMKMIATE